jgi:hypothetical protein
MACFFRLKKAHADSGDSIVQKLGLVLSFRIALEMKEEEEEDKWKKPFRNALDKADRKEFHEGMFD